MSRKIFIPFLILTAAITALNANTRPNIILIMADDMGYGDPSYRNEHVLQPNGTAHPDQGWIQTPTMDAMAAAGIRFDRFYSASAVCSPTRASCLTGRNPYRVGIPFANTGKLGADETPLSTILAAEGYRTGHFGKWHLGTMTTLRTDANRGAPGVTTNYSAPWHFDYDTCFATESKVPTYHPYRKTTNNLDLPSAFIIDPTIGYKITDPDFYGTHYWRMPTGDFDTAEEGTVVTLAEVNSDPTGYDSSVGDGDDSKLVTDEAISFIQSAVSEGKPFFVVLWYHTPHYPAVDPEEVSSVNSSDAIKDSIEDMDTAIGNLRAELTSLGVKDDTMLWLTSDNGAEDGANSPNEPNTSRAIVCGGLLERKRSFYEGGIRVPGILEWPNGITNTGRSTSFVSSTSDYYTTILDYLDLSVPNQKALDGISLRPVIDQLSETRTTPIGFRISSGSTQEAWLEQDYKLVKSTQWELYDMTLADHLLETTPLATESNLASQSQAIQDIFNDMLADYTAWKATVDADSAYVSSAVPTTTISSTASNVTESFSVDITFSASVSGLSLSDFDVDGGLAVSLTGTGANYSINVIPNFISDVTVQLPEGAAFATSGHASATSNTLTVTVANQLTTTSSSESTSLSGASYQTVDSVNNAPADQSNNVSKFEVAEDNDVPYTTTLYVRGSSSETDGTARRVQAFLQVDLSGLTSTNFDQAILHLNGYALNDLNSVNLQAVGMAADWATSPTYNMATFGTVVDGGDITAGVDSDIARSYALDLTEFVQAWLDASQTNYGLRLQLSSDTADNGLGIQTTGVDAPYLEVISSPLKLEDAQLIPESIAGVDYLSLIYQVTPNTDYFLLKKTDLASPTWINESEKSSESSFMNFYLPIDIQTEDKGFYSLSTDDPNAP